MKRHAAPLGVPSRRPRRGARCSRRRSPTPDVPVYLLDHHALFGRDYIYAAGRRRPRDNLARSALLSRGALQLCKHLGWFPDVVHAHDWPTALAPVYLNTFEQPSAPSARTASVLTIHNLAHQGGFPPADFERPRFRARSSRGRARASREPEPPKGGMYHATKLTTVSPRYAAEIRTPEGGAGLDDVSAFAAPTWSASSTASTSDVWDPANDPHIAAHFTPRTSRARPRARSRSSASWASRCGPTCRSSASSRLTEQKGTDIIAGALERILALDAQLVVLGSGDPGLEELFRERSHSAATVSRADSATTRRSRTASRRAPTCS